MVLKNRKPLKLVVCMSLIVALAISALGLSVWASFENTHNNSGNQASDIVGVAQTQVGYSEGYNSYTKYGDWYGLPNSDWCAMFVSWCANQAGVDNSVFPSFALCSAGCDWFIKQGRFHYSGSYAPQAGDLIFYASYGNIYHVGLVTGSDGSNVYSIEGNYNEQVSNVSYSLGYGDILGYASPAYSTADSSSTYVEASDVDENSGDEIYEDSDITEIETDSYIDITDSDEESDSDVIIESSSDIEYAESDSEAETDVSVDTDSDTAADTDTESVIESDADSDSDTDTETDTEADTETDSDIPSDTDTETDTDTSVELTSDTDSVTEPAADTDVDSDTDSDDTDEIAMGDVNGDGTIDSLDALLVQRYLLFGNRFETIIVGKADVNGSGNIDIGDAFIILKMSVHLL